MSIDVPFPDEVPDQCCKCHKDGLVLFCSFEKNVLECLELKCSCGQVKDGLAGCIEKIVVREVMEKCVIDEDFDVERSVEREDEIGVEAESRKVWCRRCCENAQASWSICKVEDVELRDNSVQWYLSCLECDFEVLWHPAERVSR